MDKPINEWIRRFRGMEPDQLNNAWQAKADDELSWTEDCNFHAAVAERMKQLGHMAIDLDEDSRKMLCRQANAIHGKLKTALHELPQKMQPIEEFVAETDAYYQKYGGRTARYYMFEQGVIDHLGDKIQP